MKSKPPVLSKWIFNMVEDNELQGVAQFPEGEKQRVAKDLEEYLPVQRQLFAEFGGKYSISITLKKFPKTNGLFTNSISPKHPPPC